MDHHCATAGTDRQTWMNRAEQISLPAAGGTRDEVSAKSFHTSSHTPLGYSGSSSGGGRLD